MDDAITVISLLSLRQPTQERLLPSGAMRVNTNLTDRYSTIPIRSDTIDLKSSSESSISISEHSTSSISSQHHQQHSHHSSSTTHKRQKAVYHPIRVNLKQPASQFLRSLPPKIDPMASGIISGRPFMLEVAKHPPAKALYRRTLKPCPTVILLHCDPGAVASSQARITSGIANTQNMLVEAVLIREDRYELPLEYLDGVRVVPLSPSGTATFKKLKVMSTSQVRTCGDLCSGDFSQLIFFCVFLSNSVVPMCDWLSS